MIRLLIFLYSLLVLAYWVMKLIRLPGNRWTELLRALVEPALNGTRRLMGRFLPFLTGKGIDWSPVVLLVALGLIRAILTWLIGWLV